MAEEEQAQLPQKISNEMALRPVGPVQVRINAFQMDLNQAPEKEYQYELRFQGEYPKPGKKGQGGQTELKDLARGPRNDESKETRRDLHWSLFMLLLNQHSDFFVGDRREYVYDCALLLYAQRRLLNNGQKREFVINMENLEHLSERSRSYIRRCVSIRATLMFTEEVEIRNVQVTEPGGDRSVCHFLELLTSQRMHEQNKHFMFGGNRMFKKDSTIPLQNVPHICKEGMQKNVRFVGDNPRSSSAIIQLDAKKSAFFPGGPLLDFIMNFIQGRRPEDDIWRDIQRINKQVKGLSLQTIHLPENQITFNAAGLTMDRQASEISFQFEGHEQNLVQYYQNKYGHGLQFPRLPCVIHRRGAQESFFPIEVLQIVEGQRVPLEKQTPRLTEQMIRQCQVLPAQLPQGIERQRDEGMIQNANPFFRAHHVRVDTEMVRAEAHLLYPPALVYNPPADRVEPDQRGGMDWKMTGRRRYTVACDFPRVWAVGVVQNAVSNDECRRFCEALVQTGQQRGIQMGMPPRVDVFEETNLEYVRGKFEFYAKHKCQFVLFFAPGKQQAHPGDVHHVFKLQEVEHGVLTQHISPQIMQKGISQRGAQMVLDNILMKMNLKMGGVNYGISASQAFRQVNRIQHDIIGDQWLGARRMFFGLELSHAPPQTLYERRAGKAPANPTIVGMAYTVNTHMLRLNGTYWMQQARVATVQQCQPMINAVRQAVMNYETQSGHFPEHVFVFRAGASEGEYKKVAWWEGGAFDQAFSELVQSGKMPKAPALTVIVCQRQSNYRMIPRDVNPQGRAPEQNCQPGTILDKGVMHSSLTEFLLIGHRTIQGTAQPVRCTVVVDTAQPRTPLHELEQITNALCYQHGICTSPTSVPGVLYSAGDLAKRGRNNWRTNTHDGDNVAHFEVPPPELTDEERAQAQAHLDEQREAYYAQVSDELRPTIPTKFWA